MELCPGVGADITPVEQIETIKAITDPNDQWQALAALHEDLAGTSSPGRQEAYCAALCDFAMDSTASASTLVRGRALEDSVTVMHSLMGPDNGWGADVKGGIPEQYREFRLYLPQYFNDERQLFHMAVYNEAFTDIATREGIDRGLLQGRVPVMAGMLMDTIVDTRGMPTAHNVAPAIKRDALDVALSGPRLANDTKGHKVQQFAKLARLTGIAGHEHNQPISALYELEGTEGVAYAETFNALYESAEGLKDIFPPEVSGAVVRGTRELLANALFAVQSHIRQGSKTDTAIHLRNGWPLPVHFSESEPLQLLQSLDHVFRKLHRTVHDPAFRAVPAVANADFQIDRFINTRTGAPPTVTLYTRSQGSHTYDPAYEHGRPGKGIGASINYLVQVSDETMLPIDVIGASIDTISIRLDLERDGIALDVGSILDHENTFGSQIGRLLGLGRVLRGGDSLNHIRTLDQQYGTPVAFAQITRGWRDRVGVLCASESDMLAYMSVQGDA
jgi:hypothetical protein